MTTNPLGFLRRATQTLIDQGFPPALGRVEAVTRGDLTGWVYVDRPGIKPIQVHSDANEALRWAPHVEHSNSTRRLRYRFAIPLELIPPGSTAIIRDAHANTLRGGPVKLGARPAPSKPPQFLIVHIPKTAGTSLTTMLRSGLRQSKFCAIYDRHTQYISQNDFLDLPQQQRAFFKVVIGHVGPSFAEHLGPEVKLLTFSRRPLDRIRSHVLHHLRDYGGIITTPEGPMPLDQAITRGSSEIGDNLQTRTIAESREYEVRSLCQEHLEKAKHCIRERFAFVGFSESAASDFRKLALLLGVDPIRIKHTNKAPTKLTGEALRTIAKIDWEAVKKRNWIDEELYSWAQTNFAR